MEIDGEEIDPMDLLAPEVCINESDPLMIYNDTEMNKTQTEINHNEDVQEIIDIDDESEETPNTVNGFDHNMESHFKPGQIPEPYSEQEQAVYSKMFKEGQQGIEFYRLHCTACNAHLGSAPYNQQNRFIHPLLKVLMCKSCFDFYGSGDFDKDEDGSELYCRWCGQGGKVLCCADCPCVFCQKCIRVNQGKKGLDLVLQSEDWKCFVCNPNQIVRHRIKCRALYDYVVKELDIWRPLNRPDILEIDKSMCCKKVPSGPKRKSMDENYMMKSEKKFKKKKIAINPLAKKIAPKIIDVAQNVSSWEANPEDEVVCTPDLLMIMDYEGEESVAVDAEEDDEPESVSVPTSISLSADDEVATKKKAFKKSKKLAKPGTIPGKKFPALKKLLSKSNQKIVPNVLALFPELKPGTSYSWFNDTAQAAAKVNQNLTSKVCLLSKEQESVMTIKSLTKMHNDLQDVLGNTIDSLIEIRKKLRTGFIVDLKNLKFVESRKDNNELELNQDDSDVIIIDSMTVASAPVSNETSRESDKTVPVVRNHGYIKVKPPSELLASAVISTQNTSSHVTSIEPQITNVAEEPIEVQETSNALSNYKTNKTLEELNPTIQKDKTFEKLVRSIKTSIPGDFVKKMATVKVVLDKTPGHNIQLHSCKEFTPFKITVKNTNYTTAEDTSTTVKDTNCQEKILERTQVNGFVNSHITMVAST